MKPAKQELSVDVFFPGLRIAFIPQPFISFPVVTRGSLPKLLLLFTAVWLSSVISKAADFGQLDQSFAPAVESVPAHLTGLTPAQDGKYFVWGSFHRVSEARRVNLARMNANGSLDEAFDAHLSALSSVSQVTVQADGRALASGSLFLADGTVLPMVVRFMPDGTVDDSFQLPDNIGLIRSFTLIPDTQKIVLNGLLLPTNNVGTAVLLRLEPDGSIDESFNSAVKRGRFTLVQPLSGGKLLVEGALSLSLGRDPSEESIGRRRRTWSDLQVVDESNVFQSYSFLSAKDILSATLELEPGLRPFPPRRNQLWHLNEDGSIDDTFSNAAIPEYSLVPGPNDVIYHGETSTSLDETSTVRLRRFLSNGETDSSFTPSFGEGSQFIAVLPLSTGKILVITTRTNETGSTESVVSRLAHDGSVENQTVSPLALERLYPVVGGNWLEQTADNSILFVSHPQSFNSFQSQLVKLEADGHLQETYGTPFLKFEAIAPMPQRDGRIYLHLVETNATGINAGHLRRLQKNGENDETFSFTRAESDHVYSITILEGGDLIATVLSIDGSSAIARLANDGALKRKLVNEGTSFGRDSVGIFPDGRVALARRNSIYRAEDEPYLRFLDTEFQPEFDLHDPPDSDFFPDVSLRVTDAGKLLIRSSVQTSDGTNDYVAYYLQRLLPDGQSDPDFHSPTNPAPYFLRHITDSSGRLFVYRGRMVSNARSGGSVPENDLPPSETTPPIQRFFPDGSLDTSFNLALPFRSTVEAVWLQKDGRLLIGGIFYSADEKKISTLMRLMPDGSLDTSFTPPTGEVVPISSIAVEADGNILIGGAFDQIGGETRTGLARLKSIEHPQMKNVTITTEGISLQLDGNAGRTWWIQASEDLSLWETVRTITTGTETETVELPAPGTGNKFYRAVLAP